MLRTDIEPTLLEKFRVLEVGDRSLFADTLPQNTTLLWTNVVPLKPTLNRQNFGVSRVGFLLRALRRNEFDVIVCHAPLRNPLSAAWMLRLMGRNPLTFAGTLFRSWGVLFLRCATQTPLIVLDTEDASAIGRHNFFLFSRCCAWFKRELPPDYWKVFVGATHSNTLTPRFRRKRFFQACVDKLRPISLGIPESKVRQIDTPDVKSGAATNAEAGGAGTKCVDVFFAGALSNSHTRVQGAAQLAALQNAGYIIDIVDGGLSPAEYFARCARAWLVWSPEGYGWDCFRHYEAAVCGAVPLINQPTIHRYAPLRHEEHCLYYDVEGDGLQAAVVQALRDKLRLMAMAEAAREHVLRHHTHRKLCEHMLAAALEANATSGQASAHHA